jgi:hypothetical protein
MKGNSTPPLQIAEANARPHRGHGDKYDRKSEAAIVALLVHPTLSKAAKAAGISQVTLWRWLQRDDFQEKYREAQKTVFDVALGSLQRASGAAVACLFRNLDCGNPSSEVSAARAILDLALRGRELIELDDRLTSLERVLWRRER